MEFITNKLKFGIIAVSVILCSSCSDYLDTVPYSFETVDNLYTSETGVELGLTGCYNLLNTGGLQGKAWGSFVGGMPMMLNGGTDEVVTRDGFNDEAFSVFGNYLYSPQTSTLSSNWVTLFAGINRANYLLESVETVEMDEERRLQVKAEARFLRGLFYSYLSMFYGGVPVYTNTAMQTNPNAPRQSLETVYELVISDLEFAYKNLEEENVRGRGRATKWSAAGYLAKVYTYLASSKMNNVGEGLNFELNSFAWVDSQSYYQRAFQVTNDIISNSELELVDNYRYLFLEKTDDVKAQESLFTLSGSDSNVQGNLNLTVFWRQPVGASALGGGYGYMRPLGELFNKYNDLDPRLHHNIVSSYSSELSTKETVGEYSYFLPLEAETPFDVSLCVGKYRLRDADEKMISAAWSDGDMILLRFADILLLNAEAAYFNGNEALARQRLDEVVLRAAGTQAIFEQLSTDYYKDDFIEQLLDERSRELCFEGWRRMDLIRFGILGETIESLSPDQGKWNTIVPTLKANWAAHKIWYPLPLNDIELSGVQQNPGY
nr:RagB/SusD family nutrient uptake outer membrane protein [uncultured Allomuricauda sp.]